METNFGLDSPTIHPDDEAIHIHTCTLPLYITLRLVTDLVYTAGLTTIEEPFPDYTPISDSARNQHATTYPSNPHLMDISSLHRMMTNLTAVTEKLKKEAAVSEQMLVATEQKLRKEAEQNLAAAEQKLRDEAAAAEQKLRDEAHEIREDAAHMEERLSKDLSALKAALATANKEHRQDLDCIRDVCSLS